MLSLLKKKSDVDVHQMPHWHPDFRNYERLPDIKVVRTAFFVNGAAISVLLALLIVLSVHEWQVHVVNRQIDDWQRNIDRDKRGSDQNVTLYKKFQAEEARVVEVNTFLTSKPIFSELLLHFAATLPKKLALDSFDVRSNGLGLRGSFRGAPDQATGYASAYIEQLKNDPFIAARFDDIAFKGLTPNPGNNRVVVELFLKARPTPLKEVKKP
jgi:hypothetical protein